MIFKASAINLLACGYEVCQERLVGSAAQKQYINNIFIKHLPSEDETI